jgi:cytochrome c5
VTRRRIQPTPAPETAAAAAAFLDGQEITTTDCRRCGTQISGVNGRYACGVCGWVNHWTEGHNELPAAGDDVDASRA